MLQLTDTRKTRRVAIVAALLTFATAGVAVAQNGTLPGISPVQGGMQAPGNAQGLQSVVSRAMQLQQASQMRLNSAPTGAKTSYTAASQAFGDMLTSLGDTSPVSGVSAPAAGQMIPVVSSEQAASDVRALRAAARRAGSANETDKLNKAASLYATGTKEFLTGQLREALLETGTEPVVIRGDARAADEAARKANQPPPPKVEPPKPPTPPKALPPQNPPVPPQTPPPDPNNPPVLPPNVPPPGDPDPPVPPTPPVPPVPPTPPK